MALKNFVSRFFYGNMLQFNIEDVFNIFLIITWKYEFSWMFNELQFKHKYVLLHCKGCVSQSGDDYVSTDISF